MRFLIDQVEIESCRKSSFDQSRSNQMSVKTWISIDRMAIKILTERPL